MRDMTYGRLALDHYFSVHEAPSDVVFGPGAIIPYVEPQRPREQFGRAIPDLAESPETIGYTTTDESEGA